MTGRRSLHYAWVVLGVTFLSLISTAAVRAISGTVMQPLEQEFGGAGNRSAWRYPPTCCCSAWQNRCLDG